MNGFYMKHNTGLNWVSPFQASVSFLHSLKTLENHKFSDDFRGFRNRTLA